METLVAYSVTYLVTSNSTLATLVAGLYGLLLKQATKHLSIKAVLLCQSPGPVFSASDIDSFVRKIYNSSDCEWSCFRVSMDEDHQGQGRKTIHVELEHENMLYDDLLRELPIREICKKLVGLHKFKGYCFRIVPERGEKGLDEVGQVFGSCLLLMHLRELYDNCVGDVSGDERRLAKIALYSERFTNEFGGYAEFLSNEDIVRGVGAMEDPKLARMIEIFQRLHREYKEKPRRSVLKLT
ncbi:uncharacterized protein BDW43DRAFT_306427 [Aspergillus alliaceus]|uniref:uncharacterized protein n=1 Tax=Petromyces alliaceus TaxID=209559 RepID=UPI0012A49041|nr:uncharacterized protein BDW43DRAFT_306427 [Aspergillus alliaceus]KAB8238572.1 hypothetical protein BDW43DRAFT_306427 [Aspergillus alliaceus]